jgi:tungstate transport system substrate-binding protein
MMKTVSKAFWLFLTGLAFTQTAPAEESVLIQSTTSTANSGLYEFLLPAFEADSGLKVHVVAVGTGQAIRNAANCDGDVLLVHAKASEEQFVADGFGVQRFALMYNDFVVVGPQADPARIGGAGRISDVLGRIAQSQSLFASRGDNSGTHKKEKHLWQSAALDPSEHSGAWYRETGSGMGATLNTAVGMNAYTLTDRATWISFSNKQSHRILFEGDNDLFNQYGVILVNSEKCPQVNSAGGQRFIDWITGATGQQKIAEFVVRGQQLFYPNASTR